MATIYDPMVYSTLTERWGGTDSDDLLVYSSGPDIINGGKGTDILSVNANSSFYTISTNDAGITYMGNVTLTGIEKIVFTDKTIKLHQSGESNASPTGTPTVAGTFKVGSTLTIDATAIKDNDNFTGYTPSFKYNW